MGAGQSTEQMPQKKTLSSTIDYLAANYILTSNFQDLKNLTDPQYCKKLVILTSDVIARYLTETELEYLKQRLEGGEEVLKMSSPEKIAYFNKNSLDKMDIKTDLKKKRMCIAIAKYYVKIFHIFNAIAHTINPVYTWKDKFGSTVSLDYGMQTTAGGMEGNYRVSMQLVTYGANNFNLDARIDEIISPEIELLNFNGFVPRFLTNIFVI